MQCEGSGTTALRIEAGGKAAGEDGIPEMVGVMSFVQDLQKANVLDELRQSLRSPMPTIAMLPGQRYRVGTFPALHCQRDERSMMSHDIGSFLRRLMAELYASRPSVVRTGKGINIGAGVGEIERGGDDFFL